MNDLHELRDKLCYELREYGKKEMSPGSLDVVDKLTHTIKNLDKIIEADGYSNAGRRNYGHSRGYSYHGDMVEELRGLMGDAPDERTRQEFKRFIQKIESM